MMRLLPKIFPRDETERAEEAERAMLRFEAKIGGQLFGPLPKGHKREFFCLDEHTWVWHESWSVKGQQQMVTTRYDIRPTGVLKSQNGESYQRLSDVEALNLYHASELYYQRIATEYDRLMHQKA
jgi:hypothetical protein